MKNKQLQNQLVIGGIGLLGVLLLISFFYISKYLLAERSNEAASLAEVLQNYQNGAVISDKAAEYFEYNDYYLFSSANHHMSTIVSAKIAEQTQDALSVEIIASIFQADKAFAINKYIPHNEVNAGTISYYLFQNNSDSQKKAREEILAGYSKLSLDPVLISRITDILILRSRQVVVDQQDCREILKSMQVINNSAFIKSEIIRLDNEINSQFK